MTTTMDDDRPNGNPESAPGVGERLGEWTEGARHALDGARAQAQEAARVARRQVGRAGDSVGRLWTQQPLLIVGLAFGLGVALGAMVPVSRREEALIGPTRERLRQRAAAFGREQVERVSAVAQKAMEVARQEAEDVDLTVDGAKRVATGLVDEVADRASRVGRAVTDAARDEAAQQGLLPEGENGQAA